MRSFFSCLVLATSLCYAQGDTTGNEQASPRVAAPLAEASPSPSQPPSPSPSATPVELSIVPAEGAPGSAGTLEEKEVVPAPATSRPTLPLLEDAIEYTVRFREREVFSFMSRDKAEKKIAQLALQASQNLDHAFTEDRRLTPGAPDLSVLVSGKTVQIYVRGYPILELDEEKAKSSGFENLQSFRDHIWSQLQPVTSTQLTKLKWQRITKQIFLGFLFLLLGFLFLRHAGKLLTAAEESIEKRRDSIKPILILNEPLLRGETLGGLITLALVIGRYVTYALVTVATAALIMSQFDPSQALLKRALYEAGREFISALNFLIAAIPGLLLAIFIFLILQAALRILDLLLRGIKSGRIQWRKSLLPAVPAYRFWGSTLLIVLLGPMIIAAFFGRFGTPPETLIFLVAGAFALALVPSLANIAVGTYFLWRGVLREGHWLEVGPFRGELTELTLSDVTLVPEKGGVIRLPMVYLLFHPLQDRPTSPNFRIELTVFREGSIAAQLEKIKSFFPTALEVDVECVSLSADQLALIVTAPRFQAGLRSQILSIIADADDRGAIKLSSNFVKEIEH